MGTSAKFVRSSPWQLLWTFHLHQHASSSSPHCSLNKRPVTGRAMVWLSWRQAPTAAQQLVMCYFWVPPRRPSASPPLYVAYCPLPSQLYSEDSRMGPIGYPPLISCSLKKNKGIWGSISQPKPTSEVRQSSFGGLQIIIQCLLNS